MDILMQHVSHGIGLMLLLSMPAVLLAAGIGLIIGILQAVTQVQEQTISAAPKIVCVFMLIVLGGPFMMDAMRDFILESFHLGLEVIPKDSLMILPPKPRIAYGAKAKDDFFREPKHVPGENKIQAMMKQSSKVNELTENNSTLNVNSTRVAPKPGVGEQIYMKRRATGTLPKPPEFKKE